ncbi:MAG TPA: hypothetical protein PKC18_06680 [Lacipirellulaceae bacterium]|nr:hypothetical protein [Lacipirellulaceae bacterium]HMP05843.1 hypothetical protein [Lacipirellulaceae bacterium]
MAGLLYFADGVTTPITAEAVAALRVGYAFDAAPAHGLLEGRTPSGGAGRLFADLASLDGADLAYQPDKQRWLRRSDDDCVWVGCWTADPPTATTLARPELRPGSWVELARGERWLIPRLLAFAGDDGFAVDLPCYAARDAAGAWVNGRIVEEFAPLESLARRLYEGMLLAELDQAPRLTTDEMLDVTVQLLGVNYRVGPAEAALLELLPLDERLAGVARAAADWTTFEEWSQKKSAAVSPADSAG